MVSFNHCRHSFAYMNTDYIHMAHFPLLSLAPLCPTLLTWNPPCCDRIRPRCPRVPRKLTLPFPSPGSYTPHFKIPTPRSFPAPNIHSLGQQCEPGSQDRAQCTHDLGHDSLVCLQYPGVESDTGNHFTNF